MAANSAYIQLTLRLENAIYKEFHAAVIQGGHNHTAVLRLLVKKWLDEKRRTLQTKT